MPDLYAPIEWLRSYRIVLLSWVPFLAVAFLTFAPVGPSLVVMDKIAATWLALTFSLGVLGTLHRLKR